MAREKVTYSQVGDNYDTKDWAKIEAQKAALATSKNLLRRGFREITASRGESAYVWQQGRVLMAGTPEGLGTQNLIADQLRPITGRSGYDIAGRNTVTTIVNDLVTTGARPLVVFAYWAIEDNSWLADRERLNDLITGWKQGCDDSGASWGAGETPTLKGIIQSGAIDLAGSAVGIIGPHSRYLNDEKLQAEDRIVLIKSTGVNTNGVSLERKIGSILPEGYATRLPSGKMYGEAALNVANNYALLVEELLNARVPLHYISHITGHGFRKVMRGRPDFTYVIENVVKPPEIFDFIQEQANNSDEEMYATFNMGTDYALYLPQKGVARAQEIIREHGFDSIDAGYVDKGNRQVIIKPKNIVFEGETLEVRQK